MASDRANLLPFVLAITIATVANGAPAANVALGHLLNDADAVVVATINSAVSTGTGVALTLSPIRVIKGTFIIPGASLRREPRPPERGLYSRAIFGSSRSLRI